MASFESRNLRVFGLLDSGAETRNGPSMPTFERSIVVRAPRGPLFDLMQDYDRRLDWDPFLSEARLVGATKAGVGVRAWCVDRAGRGMETEYVSFDPPSRVAVRMTRGPWMFGKFAGAWIYEEVDADSTRVVFKYHVQARVSLGALSDFVLAKIFAREMQSRLDALKRAVESRGFVLPARGAASAASDR
jgi:ribosome-associated toxin RatA of RatAB toxin-antitoxin module